MQALIINQSSMTAEDMADVCCRHMESDSMLLFLRAVAASKMTAEEDTEMWACVIREALPETYR